MRREETGECGFAFRWSVVPEPANVLVPRRVLISGRELQMLVNLVSYLFIILCHPSRPGPGCGEAK